MNETASYLKNYDYVSEEVKFASKSLIRFRILAALSQKPQNMKQLSQSTKLSYSSISSTIHGLELKDFVYRESNKYCLANSIKILMKEVLEITDVFNMLNKFFNIVDGHIVNKIPKKSLNELHLLKDAEILESGGIDAYKIYNFIETSISEANRARCILPFYHLNFNKKLNSLVNKGKFVEIMVPDEISDIYERKSMVKYISSFEGQNNFLLIVTDKMMILGLFKENGYFDQNRLLISDDYQAITWANNLFREFKRINK